MSTPTPSILALDHVSRQLAGRTVVRDLNLNVARGEVLGLLGVNGAGKTTTLRMIAGVLAPSAGTVRLDGADLYEQPERARRAIGYLPETPPLHQELSTEEFLTFCARLHGVARKAAASSVARTLERCELGEVRRRPIAALSKGFRQRVGLAQAIVHEPELIVLDEPASGLDPVQAMKLRELVRGLGQDHAVILSTHVLPDVSACCDRVAILHRGELRYSGPAAPSVANTLHVGVAKAANANDWASLAMVASAEAIDAMHWRVHLRADASIEAFADAVVRRGLGLIELRLDAAPLESTFLAIAAADAPAQAA
ncbi:MAG: ABC transporter ATP-binding protein [Dokdonella sp.]